MDSTEGILHVDEEKSSERVDLNKLTWMQLKVDKYHSELIKIWGKKKS